MSISCHGPVPPVRFTVTIPFLTCRLQPFFVLRLLAKFITLALALREYIVRPKPPPSSMGLPS